MTKNDILMLANRGLSLNGYTLDKSGNQVDVDQANREYLRALASSPRDLNPLPTDSEELKIAKAATWQLMKDALEGDKKAMRALNALRIETVDNVIKAKSNFMSFFETVTLGESEIASYVNTSNLYEVEISWLSQEGKPQQLKVEKDSEPTMLKLENLSSKKVGYRIEDINQGRIADVALKTLNIADDMANKMDRLCYTLLNLPVSQGGCFGSFSTGLTGRKVNRIYVAHSNIITDHLPTTNDIVVKNRKTSETGKVVWLDANDEPVATRDEAAILGFFGVAVLQDIVDYGLSWGDAFGDGRLVPTGEVIVPSSDLRDILYGLGTVMINVTETDLQKQIQENGFAAIGKLFGVNWKLIPDLTIPSGVCFPKFNKVPGKVYLKPSWDKEFVNTDMEANWESRSQRKAFKNIIINQHRIRAARLTYKTDESES